MSLVQLGKIFDKDTGILLIDEEDTRAYCTSTLVSWVVECALLQYHSNHEAYPDGFTDRFLNAFPYVSFLEVQY